jgi:hypothetical protein
MGPRRNPRPTRRRPRALPPGWLVVAFAFASPLLAGCGDNLAATCPPLARPEVLSVAAADSDPCAATRRELAALLALGVVRTYQRTSACQRGSRSAAATPDTATRTFSTPSRRAAATMATR